ncbi:HET-domain-containing protein [Mytilinidion resinicola]|uniref:HET-domain-containing protein n=1 Tax=Mytilinidion resinicola TaxID=574789 RepID=A0A6A6YX76_9PEZI|nr:HET-domain-containing protein [Mytilinidion resinicola]KAF2813411.1 HET-domain-containing protein [Mytilinidion resinicola]
MSTLTKVRIETYEASECSDCCRLLKIFNAPVCQDTGMFLLAEGPARELRGGTYDQRALSCCDLLRKLIYGAFSAIDGLPKERGFNVYMFRPERHSFGFSSSGNEVSAPLELSAETPIADNGVTVKTPLVDVTLVGKGPTWLIDTKTWCLVAGSSQDVYVALSYIWGHKPFFETLKKNLEQLRIRMALHSDRGALLPETIWDAISVVQTMGDRYLWVDALCIIQDDEVRTTREINNIASIFANATLHTGHRIVQRRYHRYDPKPKPPWYGRGWTLQEHIFSRRRIIFENDGVRWECNQALWHEESSAVETADAQDPECKRRSSLLPSQQSDIEGYREMISCRIPQLSHSNRLITWYSKMNFTYPEDILRAFQGITSVLSKSFVGGFAAGLPIAFFHTAILWHTFPSTFGHRRKPHHNGLSGSYFPGWTWAGWHAEIDPESWVRASDYVRHGHSKETSPRLDNDRLVPTVHWFGHKQKDGPGIPITSRWAELKQNYLGRDGAGISNFIHVMTTTKTKDFRT